MNEHATELRELVEFRRNESYCIEPGCEYNGKPAVQGHCYHRLEDETDRYIARLEEGAESELALYRERYSGDEYINTLESMFLCATMNWNSTLDQCIRLRRENVELKAMPSIRAEALERVLKAVQNVNLSNPDRELWHAIEALQVELAAVAQAGKLTQFRVIVGGERKK